jgi:hypothetical protein
MKLKMLLFAVFAAGFAASMAFADDGKKNDHGNGNGRCHEVHLSGTVAAQSLAVTLDKGSNKAGLAAGSTVTLALGAAGQTVRVNVEACNTAADGAAAQLAVRGLELRVRPDHTSATTGTTTGTTTGGKHEDEHGHHKGTTTATTATTTTAAATTATTTTHG